MGPIKRVLVTYGSKRGGTAEIATAISVELRTMGYDVSCQPTGEVRSLEAFDAVVIGGALYMRLWHRDARRFVRRNAEALRSKAVWMFSSGSLDDSANTPIEPVPQVKSLIDLVHARCHITFGGRLGKDATGLLAANMARTRAGDWRDWERIESWAHQIGRELQSVPAHTVYIEPHHTLARWPIAFAAGIALLVWSVADMILMRSANWLQLGYLGVALTLVALATPRVVLHRSHAHHA